VSAAASEWETVRSFGPDGTELGIFSEAGSVAVDQEEKVIYVLDRSAGAVFKFDLEGNPVAFGGASANISDNELSGLSIGANRSERQLAVDSTSHTFYVTAEPDAVGFATALLAFHADGEPATFSAGPGEGTNRLEGFAAIEGVAVDSTGAIYASDFGGTGSSRIYIYRRTGLPVTDFQPSFNNGAANIAVDTNGVLYVTRTNAEVRELIPSEYPVTPDTTYEGVLDALNTNHPFSVAVDPATNEVYVVEDSPAARVVVYDEEGSVVSVFGEGELSQPEGIAVASEEERAFVPQVPAGGASQVKIFQRERCICAPTIEWFGASGVTADSAVLQARINPNTSGTTYWFEYGFDDCESGLCQKVPAAGASIAAGIKGVLVFTKISGLEPGVQYHFRVVAQNGIGMTEGPDRTFTTQKSSLGFGLSDSRAWEMVSPSGKGGGLIGLFRSGVVQAAEDGNGIAYLSRGSIEEWPDGNRAFEASSVLAHRSADGWRSKDITPPHTEAAGLRDAEYRAMTPDLSRSLLEPRDDTPLSPLATERTPYLRENSEPPVYIPMLFAGEPGLAPETAFGSSSINLMGSNRALSRIVFRSSKPLVAGAAENSLYNWSEGQIQVVSELPAAEGGGVVAGSLGSNEGSVREAVSEDGRRVFWSLGTAPALYLRDLGSEESVRLDVAQPGPGGAGEDRPYFQGASVGGTIVFFTDSRQLTPDASPEGRDLYRCEIPAGASSSGCSDLIDVSAPAVGSGESARVKDQAVALSEDGTRIYFVAEGELASAPNQQGATPVAAEPNLYIWEQGHGVRFIATLSEGDQPNWGANANQPLGEAGHIAADASPNGRYLAFMSERSLTDFDNQDASSGEPVVGVFSYDAVTEDLVCISCDASGAGPEAALMSVADDSNVDAQRLWAKRRVAAILPEPRVEGFSDTFYRPRAVLDGGRVFFNAFDALVPVDSNKQWDVYQYEPTGVGSCTVESAAGATSRLNSGCVSLISSGTGEEEAAFLDASPSGDDAFFITPAMLSPLDVDTVNDIYDARVNGIPQILQPIEGCSGEACHAVGTPPPDVRPASEAFRGRGNRIGCRKGKHRVRRHGKTVCIRHKSRKHRRHTRRSHRQRNTETGAER
jgi:DNA-binding beta-propeller fold protein YncE